MNGFCYYNKNLLGKDCSASYVIEFGGDEVKNLIRVTAGNFQLNVGNMDGLSQSKSGSKKDKRPKVLLGTFPIVAHEIRIDITLTMSLNAGVTFYTDKLLVTLSGSVDLNAELGVGTVIKLTAGVKGTIIGASFTCGFNTITGSFLRSESRIAINSGTITGYLKGEIRVFGIFGV